MSWWGAGAALAGGLGVVGALGCGRSEGVPFACECEWLTDFDDASTQAVRVCAREASDALEVARGCAQLATPAPVQRCSCVAAVGAASPCRVGCQD